MHGVYKIDIVIVTYKSEEKIFNCLNSISSEIPVIIIENSNNKEFKTNIEQNYPNVHCELTGENKGYAAGNNIGLSKVKTKYALILNPDTILNDNVIKNFLITANNVKDFWLIGPANDQMVKLDFEKKNLIEVNNLKGFAIFLNMSKFTKKVFDENFFLFFEEIDLCKRVKKIKGKIYLDNNIIIKHEGASSVKGKDSLELEKNRNWHWMWSTFYYHQKYKGFFLAFIIILPKLFSAIIKTLIYSLILNKRKKNIYFSRLSGLFNSMIGKKSWYEPYQDN